MTRRQNMPVVARRGKIKVLMYYNDHAPPHVHVDASGDAQVVVSIVGPSIPDGILSKPDRQRVLSWIVSRQVDLMENWDRASRGEEIQIIGGL